MLTFKLPRKIDMRLLDTVCLACLPYASPRFIDKLGVGSLAKLGGQPVRQSVHAEKFSDRLFNKKVVKFSV